ncbi:MAG: bifunctional diaminohydroxyphosphoribosylaminopyrimidine deaminase/5-amino-6-(5-phosphoribosylamino)uracil reductase RibD [Gammaproteobacteria bacterium]|nr:bifunctional diaminohydroxyphosphoribosylaminopyrimidine deaminase/5-amino-6-(5-phosphoribosylamino)uracil reductase RibD [Gammaproteobacteria bacterium]MDH3374708.1 bifunctional diaminohydroxyphosphoribosylaminopyrimidine deaminase/5-amino-6-(5-phosphoribosylamino)uracil reductase RibD [Gammaproteobacteria bacterium]MDH3554044.1 bifunctional diaminohydroxyphosphoribosylaminopyrimidine deaminase/5-amino-6-(5-phosphoribosylamino)uracil reductase RibD [Gammaproteobacteria bacterium]
MSEFTATDCVHMARALRLAERGQYSAHPNPMVGCVLVRDGEVVGEGWHKAAGEAHAEIIALHAAGEKASGATAYVTLEPCAHQGKTPPCVAALVDAGVAEVVVALKDPNPAVNGQGLQALAGAGIQTRVGLMHGEVELLLRGFLSRVTRQQPFVRLKMASSLDGCIAMATGESQWITGADARADVQRLRARSGAIMTGIGTVLADDPSLTVRDTSLDNDGKQPFRVVLDRNLRMPLSAEMLALAGRTLVYCHRDKNRHALVEAGAQVIKVEGDRDTVDAKAVLHDLADRQVNDVLVEAGPRLAGNLIENGLVDELVIYQSPHIMGSETIGMFRTPTWTTLADRRALEISDVRRVGADTRITARFAG